jgi:ketosteroid isomerase-like protein
MKKTVSGLVGSALFSMVILGFVLLSTASAQTSEEKAITTVLQQNATGFAKNDMPMVERVWANSDNVIVFEGGHANYGWADYRDNHLAPEMKEMKNTKYDFSDIRTKVSGNMAFATMKYEISGDIGARHVEGGGLATAVLEKIDGKWKIVHWHSSAPRRAAPTPATGSAPNQKKP